MKVSGLGALKYSFPKSPAWPSGASKAPNVNTVENSSLLLTALVFFTNTLSDSLTLALIQIELLNTELVPPIRDINEEKPELSRAGLRQFGLSMVD